MIDQVGVADSDEQRALVEAVTQLLERHWPDEARAKAVTSGTVVSECEVWSALAKIGIAGLPIAADRGGSGGTWTDLAVALECVGAALAPVPTLAVAGVLAALESVAPSPQTDDLRRKVCEGTLASIVWSETHGSWGPPGRVEMALDSTATGTITLVLSPEAEHLLVPATGPDGPVLLSVATSTPGIDLTPVPTLDPTRPMAELQLQHVPAEIIAAGEDVDRVLRTAAVAAGLALAAESTGAAGRCLTGAVDYALTRIQFGKPIGSFQAIKHRCAEALTQVEQARAATRDLASRMDDGAALDELENAVALALLAASQAGRFVAEEYLQILGGIGYTWEHEAHLYLRRAIATAPLFGGAPAHRRRLDPTTIMTTTQAPSPVASLPEPAQTLAQHVSELLPRHREIWGDDQSFEARMAWQKALHSVGWAAPHWPEEYGGRGLEIAHQVACKRVLAEAGAPLPLAGTLGLNNVAPTIMQFGDENQKRHLTKILSGEEVWCQGFSEPGSGSDLASLRTRATPVEDGFVINGQKIWTSDGMEGTHCMLLARTDPDAAAHKGISALIVPLDSPGVIRRPITQITGEASFAEVFFDDVWVPREALLGPLHRGWSVTMTTLAYERSAVIEMAAGLEKSLADIVNTLRDRDLDDNTRIALTDRLVEARLVGLLGTRALARISAGGTPGAEHSVIKLLWSRTSQRQQETRLAALGLSGIRTDTNAAAQYDYFLSRSLTIAGGTTEVMRNILAERVLGLPR